MSDQTANVSLGAPRALAFENQGETRTLTDAATSIGETKIKGVIVYIPGSYNMPVCHGVRGRVRMEKGEEPVSVAFDIPFYPATEEEELLADTFFAQNPNFIRNGHVAKLTDLRAIGAWEAEYKRTQVKHAVVSGVAGSATSPRAAEGGHK